MRRALSAPLLFDSATAGAVVMRDDVPDAREAARAMERRARVNTLGRPAASTRLAFRTVVDAQGGRLRRGARGRRGDRERVSHGLPVIGGARVAAGECR